MTKTTEPLWRRDENAWLSKYRQFLAAIGVSHACEALMYHETTAEHPGLPGYIKFYGSGCDPETTNGETDRDWQLADQFEEWLKKERLSYFRGYLDEQDGRPDRRFFLGHDAVGKLRSIYLLLGLTDEDLNCA